MSTVATRRQRPRNAEAVLPERRSGRRRAEWISEGWNLFRIAALMWIVLMILLFIAAIVVAHPLPGQRSGGFSLRDAGGLVLGCFALEAAGS